jgi:SEC-C motif
VTFIITAGNLDQVIQVSDRLFTPRSTPEDEEQNKTGTLVTADGRFAYAFTGIARVGHYKTRDWLISNLPRCGAPTYESYHVFEELKSRAARHFQNHPDLRLQREKNLGVIFAGYLYRESPPRLAYCVVSNFGCADFQNDYHIGTPRNADFAFVQPFGFLPALRPGDTEPLLNMLAAHKPAHAILGKTVDLMRTLADRPEAGGMVGKQLCSITLSIDPHVAAQSDYHSAVPTSAAYMPDFVVVNPSSRLAVSNISLRPVAEDTPPSAGPRLGRNRPCFCGSGKKYKRCHGRWQR